MTIARFLETYCCKGLKLAIYTRNEKAGELKSEYEGTKEDLVSAPIHNLNILLSNVESIDVGQTRTLFIMAKVIEQEKMATENVEYIVARSTFDGPIAKETIEVN